MKETELVYVRAKRDAAVDYYMKLVRAGAPAPERAIAMREVAELTEEVDSLLAIAGSLALAGVP